MWKRNEDFESPHHYSESDGFRLLSSGGSDETLLKMPLIGKTCWAWLALSETGSCSAFTPTTPGHLCSPEDEPLLDYFLIYFLNFPNFPAPPHSPHHQTCTPGHQIIPQAEWQAPKPWGSVLMESGQEKGTWSSEWKILLRAATPGQQLCSASTGIILEHNKSL